MRREEHHQRHAGSQRRHAGCHEPEHRLGENDVAHGAAAEGTEAGDQDETDRVELLA